MEPLGAPKDGQGWEQHIVNYHTTLIATLGVITMILITVFLVRRVTPTSTAVSLGSPEGLARLLVAEIRMYHGNAVDRAWSQSAIYRLLKDDIDRSRQVFLVRFPESEHAFYGAVVAVLARGEADRLGTDYPYPRTRVQLPADSA
jgi:hypothetical protein